MCLEKDLLGYVGTYMSRDFIRNIDLDVRYTNWNNSDGSRDGSVQFGVLWGGRRIQKVVDNYHFDQGEVKDIMDIGLGYFAYLQKLLVERTSGLKWEVDSNRILTLRLTRTGRPEDVRVLDLEEITQDSA